ncbi:hypothetical protein Tco_1362060 [Tanacetum coccineum]
MCETLRNKVPKLTVSTTNDLMKESLPKMVNDVVTQERESAQAINTVLNVHPTTSASTATTTSDLQQQLYMKMKSDLQAQVVDPENDAFCKRDHDEHQGDDALPEGEKSMKRQKTFKDQSLQEVLCQNNQSRKPTLLHQNNKRNNKIGMHM